MQKTLFLIAINVLIVVGLLFVLAAPTGFGPDGAMGERVSAAPAANLPSD